MPDVTIIGHGLCPKCGKQTDIKNVHWFPFPEEEQSETIETCLSCGFKIEKDFISSNTTTSFDHHTLQDITKQRVERAIQGISGLISDYKSFPTQSHHPNITDVTEVLEPLQMGDFPLLYVELVKLANSPLGEVCFNYLAEVMSDAEGARQFAQLGGGQLSEGMAEWYENEGRSAAKGSDKETKMIDSIIELVKMVEEKKKNS